MAYFTGFLITTGLRGNAFSVREPDPVTGKVERWATPLFLALVLIEFVDLVFAVDSVPAIFAITTDPFIVYTSNIFAILGLRALYFFCAGCHDPPVQVPQVRAGAGARIHRNEDIFGRVYRQVSARNFAHRHLRPDCRWRAVFAVEDAQPGPCRPDALIP